MGVPPSEATIDQVADALIRLFQFSKAQARNYSAMLLIPGFGGLRFHTLLAPWSKEVRCKVSPMDCILLGRKDFDLVKQFVDVLQVCGCFVNKLPWVVPM